MFTPNARMIAGADSMKIWRSRKDAWTSGQPGALTTIQPRTVKTTTVLTSAIALDRTARRSNPPRREGPAVVMRGG